MPGCFIRVFGGVLISLAVLVPLRARPADRPAGSGITLSVDSRLVLVPVTVTDRKGRSVMELRSADFHLFDNSVERRIVSFSRDGTPVSMAL